MNSKIVLANLWLSVEGKNIEKKNWKKGLGFYFLNTRGLGFYLFYKKGIGSELMKMFMVLTYITKIIKFICFKCQYKSFLLVYYIYISGNSETIYYY